MRILLADDATEMRHLLAAVLRASGHEVEEACDGAALRERLRAPDARGLDLLVTDVQMPGWTGLQALEWVSRHLPELAVVLITAFGDRGLHARAAALGAVTVLDKPFELGALKHLVTGLAGRTRTPAST
jgi:CheY-like chemotaxis protein